MYKVTTDSRYHFLSYLSIYHYHIIYHIKSKQKINHYTRIYSIPRLVRQLSDLLVSFYQIQKCKERKKFERQVYISEYHDCIVAIEKDLKKTCISECFYVLSQNLLHFIVNGTHSECCKF